MRMHFPYENVTYTVICFAFVLTEQKGMGMRLKYDTCMHDDNHAPVTSPNNYTKITRSIRNSQNTINDNNQSVYLQQ